MWVPLLMLRNYTFDANWMALAHTNNRQIHGDKINLYTVADERMNDARKKFKSKRAQRTVLLTRNFTLEELGLCLRDATRPSLGIRSKPEFEAMCRQIRHYDKVRATLRSFARGFRVVACDEDVEVTDLFFWWCQMIAISTVMSAKAIGLGHLCVTLYRSNI